MVRTGRSGLRVAVLFLALLSIAMQPVAAGQAASVETPVDRARILDTMKRATRFMVEEVAVNGGYVWSYLPDKSRRWGEIEAYPSMIWVQPPGTATMGHLFLDAYHATDDDYYYRAADQVAGALIAGQHRSGGWHYFVDFGGQASTSRWYETIGRNAWRMEEFQHDWRNATFDDGGTSEAMQFLLRLYLEKRDPRFRPALDRAIDFVLTSQYPVGGWPQRFPLRHDFVRHGRPDYTSYITFNDDVAGENIRFLTMVYQTLRDDRIPDAITRAMNVFLVTQQADPQPAWALQHTLDLKPAGARSYEPPALATHTTASNLRQLMGFYRLTGDRRYLSRIPDALDWLDRVALPAGQVRDGRTHPTFIELGTNQPLYIHRRGSNVVNGDYYADHDPANTVGHYSSTRAIDVAGLRREYERLSALSPEQASLDSPLKAGPARPLPRFFVVGDAATSDLNSGGGSRDIGAIVATLNADGWWPTELRATSNRYAGDGPAVPPPGDYRRTHVGDRTDTSPFMTDNPMIGISTGTYIENMKRLIGAL